MDRDKIEKQYTWDLSTIYKDEDEFQKEFNLTKEILITVTNYKGIITNSIDQFTNFLKDKEQLERKLNTLYCFCHLHCDVEPNNQTYQTMFASVQGLIEQVTSALSFIDSEICSHNDIVKDYLKAPHLLTYKYSIESVLKAKAHMLSPSEEDLLAKVDSISHTSHQVFDAMRLEYDDVLIDGKKEPLNSSTLVKYLKHNDPLVRKNAYTNFFKEYKRFENVFATTLAGNMKKDAFYSEVRKFSNPLEASVFDDDVPSDLFFKVLKHANVTYRPLFHEYNSFKKQVLNLKEAYNYDLSVPLVSKVNKKYTIEESFNLIKETLKPFGKDYIEIIDKAKTERWIDFYPSKGKRIGAYSSGTYDTNPFILMNYIGDYQSLSTLMHELGHSVHSYYSRLNQDYTNANYRIFVAEVASTVNETLLINHMINNATSEQEKAYYIYEQLENCVGLLYRQPMFAQFEYNLHQIASDKGPLSSKVITDIYTKLNQEYYGKDILCDEHVGYSCYYVPHFYYNFYVYKYTVGMTVALAISKRILDGDTTQVEKYLQFLKSGGSASPIDLLKNAGVNPLDDDIYHDAFAYFKQLLATAKQVM